MHSEEAHNDCNHFDSIHWEEKYEKMWVANEKKEVKANFKSITAELKQMFGEMKVYEKTSITPSKATSQDGFCCAVEGIKETSLHLQNIKVDIQGKGDIKDVRSVITERELNTDDWNTNRNPLFNNAKGTKVNMSEEKNNNTITQLQADETKAAEKCLEYSLQSHEDITKDTVFKTIDVNQPIASNNLFKHISVTKNPSEETEYHFNNSINSCKGTDIEIGNKAKNHKQLCPQISKKGLDEELEGDVARFKNQIEEEKIKKELESKGKKIANAEKLAVNNDEKIEQKHSINEIQHITADSIFPADKKEVICLGLKATRKSENKRRNSKQKVSQQLCNNLHQSQDESSLSEASLEERYPAKSVNGKNKLYRTLSITNDLDDLTPSSDSTAEDIESLSSIYKEAIVLIEELSLDCKDSVSLLKVQNIFHGYERLIEHEKGRNTQLLEKVKKFENQRNEWQKNLEDLREMKSILDHQKLQYESEITNLKFCLKQEEETRKGAVMLHEKNQEQLRKKDEQYCTQMEEKQQLELMLRSKEMELKTLTNHLKQVEEEHNETQRQLCQEQNARTIQEDILNTHFWRQKELEEESKKVASKHSEVQKENMLSLTAQGAQNMWEEELKLKPKLGIRLSELDKEKTEIISQFENEKKKVKKVLELKRSVELRLDQEIKRNSELQKEYHGMKKLLKITKKKLKGYESGESSSQISLHGEIKNKYSEIDNEVGKLRKRVDELSRHLEVESKRCTQLESTNCELSEQLASMKTFHKNHEKLEKSKLQLEEEVANLKRQVQDNLINVSQVEQYKTEIEERARKDIRQKLEEVNFFLQTQAASQETLEQIRATNNASLRNQLENRIKELETELAKLKNSQQDIILQKESSHTELERYKGLYSEELKIRKSLGSKLDRANAKLAEASTQLYHERHKNKSLLANSFLSGSLSSSPVLETVHMGNLGNNLALNKSLNLGGGFLNTNRTASASKTRMEAFLAKMQMELEKSIIKELDQAKAEFDAGSVRVSPVGSVDGSSKKSNIDQDQVSKARQQYLDVLKKNYMI